MSSPGMLGRTMLVRVVAPLIVALVVLGGVGVALWSNASAGRAATAYQQKRHELDARLQAAGKQGYTADDLRPVTSQLSQLDTGQVPWWMPGRTGYFEQRTTRAERLESELDALQRQLFTQAQGDAAGQLDAARAEIVKDQQSIAADIDVQALQQRAGAVAKAQGAAHTLHDYRLVTQQAKDLTRAATALYDQTQQENQAIDQAAAQLVAQVAGNLGAVQQAGNQAIAAGHNDASVAAYMNKPSPFKGYDAVQRAASRLEKFAALVPSGDVGQAARGTAGVQRFAAQVRDALMAGLPRQAVVVSFQDQHLWALQDARVVLDSPVTTGIRGVTDIGTDFGPMKVVRKSHPWTMHSPWPKTSPNYYPDTEVQWTVFFTWTGEAIHDASWEPDSLLGPGSQYNPSTRSHGCVHLPLDKSQWMYNWAPLGMPVIVYPGDGSPVANQLAQITTDDHGTPRSAG